VSSMGSPSGRVLQVNPKPGEFGAANSARPLVSLGGLSALRVRAELEEQDDGAIKMQGIIRADAFRDRDFAGTVASIAPIVRAPQRAEPTQSDRR
jgi:HlyD family secretion protein